MIISQTGGCKLPLWHHFSPIKMQENDRNNITNFWVVGINYKKSDAGVRGKFAINNEQYEAILNSAHANGVPELFILSTCNRTEAYGFAPDAETLMHLVCSQADGDLDTFSKLAYVKNGAEAMLHLFHVSAGLDSQILGDFEILGQIKTAVKFSKEKGRIGTFVERLVNCVLQSSKAIKTHTQLSGGTVSVSFAAVQYIREHVQDISDKKILLLGTGKIGRNTCKNMVDYLGTRNVTLINRTEEKATKLAEELNLNTAPYSQLDEEIRSADIILVATNAQAPTVLKKQLEQSVARLVIDLSIPYNVEAEAQELCDITFLNVDQLSRIKDETLQRRKAEVPRAKALIAEHVGEFMEWYDMRKNVPVLKEAKTKLQAIHASNLSGATCPVTGVHSDEKIQKVINNMAMKMKKQDTVGCIFIDAINDFIG
jgi:glutamyl-tRNA reductase